MSDHRNYDWTPAHHSHVCAVHGDYLCPWTICGIQKGAASADFHCSKCVEARRGVMDLRDFEEATEMFTRPRHSCSIHGIYTCPYNACYVQGTPGPGHCPKCFAKPKPIAPVIGDRRQVAEQISLFG